MILTFLLLTTNFLNVAGEVLKLGEHCLLADDKCESGTKCKCVYLDSWGWTCIPKCQTKREIITFNCKSATMADGVGPVYRTDAWDCENKMQPKDGKPAQSFIYYEGSLHCQATNGANTRSNGHWKLCKPSGSIFFEANTKVSSGSNTSLVVNVFAALGLSFALYGAFRHYTQK